MALFFEGREDRPRIDSGGCRSYNEENKKGKVIDMDHNAKRKFCTNCGAPLAEGMKFCNHCGTPVPQQAAPAPQQNYSYGSANTNAQSGYSYGSANAQGGYNYGYAAQNGNAARNAYASATPLPESKKEYRKTCTNEKYRKTLKTNAIIMYVLVGLNLVLSIAANISGLLDVAITLALTLGMHIAKSKGCAVGILIYSIVNMVILLILNGSVGGWLWLVMGISCLKAFSIADKEYEELTGRK